GRRPFGFPPHRAVGGVGGWPVRAEGARPSGRKGQTVVCWLASLAPPPGLRPYSPVPLPFHGGEIQRRGRQAARETRWLTWLASLAPPPGLRPYSPVPLPFHGGEIQRRGWQAARGFPLTTES